VWHSALVEAGVIRTNYYLKELYGDPDEDPWRTTMAVLAREGKPQMFMHPVVEMLIEVATLLDLCVCLHAHGGSDGHRCLRMSSCSWR
jgi:hypothetical protein